MKKEFIDYLNNKKSIIQIEINRLQKLINEQKRNPKDFLGSGMVAKEQLYISEEKIQEIEKIIKKYIEIHK